MNPDRKLQFMISKSRGAVTTKAASLNRYLRCTKSDHERNSLRVSITKPFQSRSHDNKALSLSVAIRAIYSTILTMTLRREASSLIPSHP